MKRMPRAWVLSVLAAAVPVAAPTGTVFAPPAARADDAADNAAAARAAADDLTSPDDAVRAKGAARIAGLGHLIAAEIARRVGDLDDRAWEACAEAFVQAKCSRCAYTFVAAARKAPPAHARRLLDLAHALNPLAGVRRSPAETAAEVRRLLDGAARARCSTGYAEEIALLGHDALEPLLAGMRDGDPTFPGGSTACNAVGMLAEKEDLPAIRALLLEGKVNLVDAVERMRKEGTPEAAQVLLDAAVAGRLEFRVMRALAEIPDCTRVFEVVDAVMKARPEITDAHRASLAWLFERIDARASVPTLESWIATSRDPGDFVAIGDSLVHFGSPKGVGILVRIASERRTRFPCRPSTPKELASASAPGRLCAEGFFSYERERAARKLAAIAGTSVFDLPDDLTRHLAGQGRDHESEDDFLDRAATAFRAWWEASKDRLRFDAERGRWIVGE